MEDLESVVANSKLTGMRSSWTNLHLSASIIRTAVAECFKFSVKEAVDAIMEQKKAALRDHLVNENTVQFCRRNSLACLTV